MEDRPRRDKILLLQRFVGGLYVLAAAMKLFPGLVRAADPAKGDPGVPEDVGYVLRLAHDANVAAGSWVAGPSGWFADHPGFVVGLVTVAMFALGIVYILDRGLVRVAVVGNAAMLFCFMAVLHDKWPAIFVIDGLCLAAAVAFYRRASRRGRPVAAPAPAASTTSS